MTSRARRAAVMTVVAVVGAGVATAVVAGCAAYEGDRPGGSQGGTPDDASSGVPQSPDPDYWTPERLRSAEPAPMPSDD